MDFCLRGFTSPFSLLFFQRTLGKGDNIHWNELTINSDVLDLASPFIPGIPCSRSKFAYPSILHNQHQGIYTPCWHLKREKKKKRMEIFWLQNGIFGIDFFFAYRLLGPTVHLWKIFFFVLGLRTLRGEIVYHRKTPAGDWASRPTGYLLVANATTLAFFLFYFIHCTMKSGGKRKENNL